jgi:Cu(I)/Ag(I) efflux system membrane fusion protein
MKIFMIGAFLLLAGCGERGGHSDAGKDAMGAVSSVKAVWTCPMHPEVVKDRPGSCPICGMDLVKKETAVPRVKEVSLEDLLRPTTGFVVSSVATTVVQRETIQPELAVFGTVGYDTRLQNTIAARVSGRIEKLYVRYRYQHVHQGQL